MNIQLKLFDIDINAIGVVDPFATACQFLGSALTGL